MPGFSTRAIKAASRVPVAPQAPVNVPIYQTSTFEVALAELEGAEACLVTASGMAAIHAAVLSTVRSGESLVIPRAVYGGVVGMARAVLDRSGIETRSVDTTDLDAVAVAIDGTTRLVWPETRH